MSFVYLTNVLYRQGRNDNAVELPALFTETGIVISHLRYIALNHNRSQSWLMKSTCSLKLLIQWMQANEGSFSSAVQLLQDFCRALSSGTIDYEKADDSSGLYWKPRQPTDVNNILRQITQYTDWLERQDGYSESRINPFRKATNYEQRLAWCAYYHQNFHALTGYLMTKGNALKAVSKARTVTAPMSPMVNHEYFFRFPEDKIDDLLYTGMVRAYSDPSMAEHVRLDYKNIAITMLMHYGGLRISEVFHIYTCDITLHPTQQQAALVHVYHPSYGASPDPRYTNRKEYLNAVYGMKPRDKYPFNSRLFAGWKLPALTDGRHFFEVFFAPDEMACKFLEVWAKYLKYQRVDPPENDSHPYAFTNQSGQPETISNFRRIYKRAATAIGLDSGRYSGATLHGHRHSYGYRLASLGLDQQLIQKALHHKNPFSCLSYLNYTNEDLRQRIQAASKGLL